MNDILSQTSMAAAEAVFELNPCERIERWIESITIYPKYTQRKSESLANKGFITDSKSGRRQRLVGSNPTHSVNPEAL